MTDLEPLHVECRQNTSTETVAENIESSLKRDLPELNRALPAREGIVCIVGGGPSLKDTLPILSALHRDGAKVWAINGAHDWLRDRGIHADGMVMVDSRPENVSFVQCPIPEATYYLSYRCHPDLFDALEGANVVRVTLQKNNDCGSTSGMLALCVAYCEGFRDIRLFGFDSSYRDESGHAYAETFNKGEPVGEYWCAGQRFLAAPWMALQVEDFQRIAADLANNDAAVTVYGDGLLPTAAKVLGDPNSEHRWSADTVGTAYYDLTHNPPTFNFIDFLLQAEAWRIAQGIDRIEVKVLPGPKEGFRDDKLPPYGGAERMRWLKNICLPMAALLPSCGKPAELVSRSHVPPGPHFGRGKYTVGFANMVQAARMGLYPLKAPDERSSWARHGKYVTITLRDPGWWKGRTSNRESWLTVATEIRRKGYVVVFVRDGEASSGLALSGFPVVELSKVTHRATLYAGAELNMGINGGPMLFSWFMGLPTLVFFRTNDQEPASTAARFIGAGLPPGEQLANARPRQRMVWAMDDAETVLKAFDEVMA